jgi:ATP-dependent DNA helicase RecQ
VAQRQESGSRPRAREGKLDRLAREALDIEQLRPGQREAVTAAIEGRDLLAVMPTGYGKSAIYQLAGMVVDGSTVVVSPLIALQRDQVDSLDDLEAGEAAFANSSMRTSQRRETFERLREGDLEFVVLAPEQLAREDTIEELRAVEPSLFVVDEAHLISSWGHDFRPDYLRLGEVIDELGHPTVIALTATAAPPVRDEIVERLRLREPKVVVHGFDRPNLHLGVERFEDGVDKDDALLNRAMVLAAGGNSGIIYAGTRKRTEQLAGELSKGGVPAVAYHAGLKRDVRDEAQRMFMDDEVAVVVATTAFGMGIDKPDVRFVLHGDIAESIDAYYQEIGRAGRDGEPAEATVFCRPADLSLRRFLGAGGGVRAEDVQRVAGAVEAAEGDTTVAALRDALDLSDRKLRLVLTRLEDEAAIDVEGGRVEMTEDGPNAAEAADAIAEDERRRKEMEASRLEMMRGYAETRACRRRFLLTYFGEDYDHNCGYCDNCESGSADRPGNAVSESSPFPEGASVRHVEWGDGQVIRTEVDKVVVLFPEAGYKTLSAGVAAARGLLTLLHE